MFHPIVLPELLFVDRFNNRNRYVDMNPSIHISESGEVKILVRRVNYKKFSDKNFVLYAQQSNSAYVLLTGIIDNSPLNLEKFSISNLETNYRMQKYPTYWTGIEDVRFITDNSILATIPECNPSGNPCIFHASLDKNIVTVNSSCAPNLMEKNWMPYIDHLGVKKVIYSLSPFVIKSIENDDRIILPIESKDLQDYHGSTNGIPFDGKSLFLIHINKEKSYHRWLLFDTKSETITVSEPFVFFKHSHIEFTCSLASFEQRIFVSLGVNDDRAFIVEFNKEQIKLVKVL